MFGGVPRPWPRAMWYARRPCTSALSSQSAYMTGAVITPRPRNTFVFLSAIAWAAASAITDFVTPVPPNQSAGHPRTIIPSHTSSGRAGSGIAAKETDELEASIEALEHPQEGGRQWGA